MLAHTRKLSRVQQSSVAVVVAALLQACGEPPTVIPPVDVVDPPVLLSATPRAAPENVLSARVAFTARAGSLVQIAYWVDGDTTAFTPYHEATGGTDTIVVLGLRPSTSYRTTVAMRFGGLTYLSQQSSFTTAELPAQIAALSMTSTSGRPTPLALTSSHFNGSFAVAFDRTGAVVWYHDFSALGPMHNVMRQANGNYTAFIGNTAGWQPNDGYYVEITPEGRQVAEYHAPAGYYMDNHDILLTDDGASKRAHFFTFNIQSADFSSWGGKPSVQLAGHQIVRMDPSGHVEFMWNAWEQVDLHEWVGDAWQKESWIEVDFDHPNALTFDHDGNYVVSWRNLDQVMGVHAKTGEVLWRLGGVKSDFEFEADPFHCFSKQHAVKVLPSGNLLLYDNGTDHEHPESRAVEYQLDSSTGKATMVWQYRHAQALYTPYVGWVERLSNANTWVAFAGMGRVVEVDENGSVVWDGQLRFNGQPFGQYRILALASLY